MSIADKLNYLITTKGLLKDNINKINNVLDDNSTFRSYPQELFNGYLDILNNGTDTLWNNLEKVSQTGTEAVLEGVETAPMKVELQGNTSQDGTPTPDTPVEVKVVTGENVVSVQGKNLFDINYYLETQYNTNGSVLVNRAYFKDGENITTNVSLASGRKFFNHKKLSAGTYTMSFNKSFSGTGHHIRYSVRDFANLTDIVATQSIDDTNTSASFSFTLTEETDVYISIQPYSADEGTLTLSNIQLELGSQATPYASYSKTDYPISLGTIEMCKIGNYKDYLFKRNGSWYVHKEINKTVLGELTYLFESSATTPVNRTVLRLTGTSSRNFYFSNIFDSNKQNDTTMANRLVTNVGYSWFISLADSLTGIISSDSNSTKIAKMKDYLQSKNAIVYYFSSTPTEEEITNTTLIEQLEAIYKAKSVKDKTYITQTNDDLPFILDVEAIKEYEVV